MKPITKFVVLPLVIIALLLGGAYGARKGYRSLKQKRLVKQAREFMAKSEPKKAFLSLQRALNSNRNNVEACRLMAQLLEQGRSPAALIWRARVVELLPSSTDDRLILAETALERHDLVTATNALDGISLEGKKTARYHNDAAVAALADRALESAEQHYREACRLDPQDGAYQLNLSVVRLQTTNEQTLAEVRTGLKQLSENATNAYVRCQATRELIGDAVRFNHLDKGLELVNALLSDTNSTFGDRLLRLDLLRATTNSDFTASLKKCQEQAGTDPAKIYELAGWRVPRLGAVETLDWLRTLPDAMQTNQPMALLIAECLDLSTNWVGLQAAVQKQDWAETDFIRRAYLARAFRGQELETSAKAEWQQAQKMASAQLQSLRMLLRLASQWKWENEAEEILAVVVNRFPKEKWAFEVLTQLYFVNGRTRPLMMLFSQEMKRSPAEMGIKNNLAVTALLLEASELKPHELASEVYRSAPTNAAYVSTYAFSLLEQKKNAEALKVFQTLPEKDLQDPSIAGYYGLVLKRNGDAEKAKTYFDLASKAKLLPEEKKMFEREARGA